MVSLGRAIQFILLCIGGMLSVAAVAQSKTQVDLDIPAQALEISLKQVADLQKLQIIYVRSDLAGKESKALKGRFTPQEAISNLIESTGLTATFNGPDTVVIKPVAGKDKSSATAPRVDVTNEPPVRGESIRVTAQKRDELLVDVPQSVTVLTARDLAKNGALQFRDFASAIPGLTFTTQGAGLTQINLRGVTTGADLASTVASYLDDVPYGSSTSFTNNATGALDVALFDLNRIEVLRGPQGTLYGSASMGGLIKYVSRLPDVRRFEGEAVTGVAGTSQGGVSYNVAGVINAPVVADRVALRASAFQSHDGGYIDNVGLGSKDVNRSDIYGGRLDLLWLPTNGLSIRLGAFTQDIDRDGQATADFTPAGTPLIGSLIHSRPMAEPFEQQYRLVSGTVTYDLPGSVLTSISSYQTPRTQYALFSPALMAVFGQAYRAVGSRTEIDVDKFTQEVRLVSNGSRHLEWIIGGVYTRESARKTNTLPTLDMSGAPVANNLLNLVVDSHYEDIAGFADLTYHLTDRFDVTGGLRYARNDQTVSQTGSGLLGSSRPTRSAAESVPTYLANVRYEFSDQATGYLRYATGYRPGGPNIVLNDPTTGLPVAPPTFEADRLKSYEAGIKLESASRQIGMELATYYIDWSNMQIAAIRNLTSVRANAPGGVTIRGAELALTARPATDLNITGTFAYIDAELAGPAPDLGGAAGEHLPNVPRFTASVGVDYSLAVGEFKPFVGGALRYIDDRKAAFGSAAYRLPSYSILDLRAGVTLGAVDLRLYVRNLLDKRGQISAALATASLEQVAIEQPRTIGVTATTHF